MGIVDTALQELLNLMGHGTPPRLSERSHQTSAEDPSWPDWHGTASELAQSKSQLLATRRRQIDTIAATGADLINTALALPEAGRRQIEQIQLDWTRDQARLNPSADTPEGTQLLDDAAKERLDQAATVTRDIQTQLDDAATQLRNLAAQLREVR
ncbi:hypothetical protein [Mycolicibacterium fortuitum]|uniref:hypothetical protein n=1 Tax=Mycolicibacterium fortuitum TaxID=1766 RepID=UPI001CE0EBF2|nr:hypothetical protein [Mycolicibacterium fortuitum]MCA4727323.1 hypothetical protein [Mycolicibacterium fortuitum]